MRKRESALALKLVMVKICSRRLDDNVPMLLSEIGNYERRRDWNYELSMVRGTHQHFRVIFHLTFSTALARALEDILFYPSLGWGIHFSGLEEKCVAIQAVMQANSPNCFMPI